MDQFEMDENKNLQPELQDIINRIMAYNVTHKEGCFVFRFVGYKDDKETICEDCGECCETYDENKSLLGLHGDLETVREMLNELRDVAEDCVDEDGFVSI